MPEPWRRLIDYLQDSLERGPQISMTVDEIVAATCCRDPHVCERTFWRAAQLGSTGFEGFVDAGLQLEFYPDRRGQDVESVTFVRRSGFPHRHMNRS
jgi:hypothetical protein